MSFILDALKKSETERQRQAGPALLEMRIVRPTRRLPMWALAVGLLLILSVGALAWLAWRPSSPPATAALPAAAPSNTMAEAAAPAGDVSGTLSSPASSTPAVAAPPAAVAAVPEPPQLSGGADTIPADANPADTEPAVGPGAAALQDSSRNSNLRTYAELGGALPELRLDLHVYAANPADRYAFINMHKVREGDTTAEGVQVKEITRDGVVLDFRGTEFLLGRQ